jgi:hypothetical protein
MQKPHPRVITAAAATGLLLAAGLAVPAAAAAAQACRPSWALAATPAPPGSDTLAGLPEPGGSDENGPATGGLGAPTVLPTGQAWFASSNNTPWILDSANGGITQATQIPAIPDVGIAAMASSFDSATDGWVLLGSELPTSGLAERWYGGRWTMVPSAVSPDPATTGVSLTDVVSVSPDDAWAVGDTSRILRLTVAGALIEHWDGTSWSIIPNPLSAQAGATLSALALVSSGDIWAVGSQGTGQAATPLAEHWNGTAWASVPVPAATAGSGLSAVSADSSGDVWATGFQDSPQQQPLAEHWNGTAWSIVTLPAFSPAGYTGALGSVYAASPDDVWAIDSSSTNSVGGLDTAVFVHWDGADWTAEPAPGPQAWSLFYSYAGIAGSGPDNIWAAGTVASRSLGTVEPVIADLGCDNGGQ